MSIPIERLVRRVEVIARNCAPDPVDSQGNTVKLDEFTRKKKDIAQHIRATRAKLKEREELVAKDADNKRSADLSSQIRADIREIKAKIDELTKIQRKEAKRARKMPAEVQEAISRREEIVKLCHQHVEELEAWERRRFAQDRDSLFTGTTATTSVVFAAGPSSATFGGFGGGASTIGSGIGNPEETELQDVEDYTDQLQAIRERNKDIDADLDAIHEGVQKLKAIAIEMGQEVDMQNKMIEELTDKVDTVEERLVSLNVKLKNQLDGVMKGDKFLVNFVLCLILLAIIGFIASQFAPQS